IYISMDCLETRLISRHGVCDGQLVDAGWAPLQQRDLRFGSVTGCEFLQEQLAYFAVARCIRSRFGQGVPRESDDNDDYSNRATSLEHGNEDRLGPLLAPQLPPVGFEFFPIGAELCSVRVELAVHLQNVVAGASVCRHKLAAAVGYLLLE